MTAKFKVGDVVICVNKGDHANCWILGRIFTIKEVHGNDDDDDLDRYYYKSGNEDCTGIWENSIALYKVTNWRKRLTT